MLRLWFGHLQEILPVAWALEAAAITGEEGSQVYHDRMEAWRDTLRISVIALANEGGLRRGWSVDDATDWIWMRTQPANYEYLVRRRGWPARPWPIGPSVRCWPSSRRPPRPATRDRLAESRPEQWPRSMLLPSDGIWCDDLTSANRETIMLGKVLVANRGEIAIRAFRAAYELGIRTVAIFPHEDRNSLHRLKADEAYEIGEPGHPVRAYLSVAEAVAAAQRSGADAIYPGYGFLSENPNLAQACADAGIVFVGPTPAVLALTGDKAKATEVAQAAGLPVRAPPHRPPTSRRSSRQPTTWGIRSSSRRSPAAAASLRRVAEPAGSRRPSRRRCERASRPSAMRRSSSPRR